MGHFSGDRGEEEAVILAKGMRDDRTAHAEADVIGTGLDCKNI